MESIKLLTILFFVIMSLNSFAKKAQVIVLEAPLLQYPDNKSKVLQRVRKGRKLYIHRAYLNQSDWEMNYNVNSRGEKLEQDKLAPDFYKTLTSAGEEAWVEKRFVKVIYLDERENELKMNPYAKNDPTDYRIEEPLPDSYPLIDPRKARAFMTFGMGPTQKTGFNYGTSVLEEDIGSKYSFSTIYARKVDFDNYNRFYFGGQILVSGQRSTYYVDFERTTQETSGEIGIGPYISYDIFRDEDSTLTLYSGFTYNFHRYSVEQKSIAGSFEERIFNGYSITPKIGSNYAIVDFIPGTNLDFIFGMEAIMNLPYTLTTQTQIDIDEYWNDTNQIDVPMSVLFNAYLGIRATY